MSFHHSTDGGGGGGVGGGGSGSAASDGTGWGTMGGGASDGLPNATNPPEGGIVPSPFVDPSPPPQTPPPQTQPPQGSITRFASPAMAAQQQQQQQQQPHSYSARSQQQQQQGYAARSLAYGASPPSQPQVQHYQQPQQPQPQPQYRPQPPQQRHFSPPGAVYTPAGYGGASTVAASSLSSSSYAARSQQQQQQQPRAYAAASNMGGGYGNGPSNVYGGGGVAVVGAGGGMAATARLTPHQQPHLQQQQQQQQGQHPNQQSFASRSAAASTALYGQPQPQPPPQPPQYNQGQPTQNQQPGMYTPQQQQQQQQQQQSQPPRGAPPMVGLESTAQQQRLLTDATRKVQEHSYYMKQAMEQRNLPVVLDRAAHMVGELGGPPHGPPPNNGAPVNTGGAAKLNPKNYYELYMRALEDMPALEEYLVGLVGDTAAAATAPNNSNNNNINNNGMIRIVEHASQLSSTLPTPPVTYTMRQLYDCVQYGPRVVSRLYLQIAAGSALIRSGECGAKWVLQDLQAAVKCEQNPVRGLFVRYFLVTTLRDKLTDTPVPAAPVVTTTDDNGDPDNDDDDSAAHYEDQKSSRKAMDETDQGTGQDSYEFVLANFMEMNKLWVRIQHLPGEGKNKDVRKRRERERNDLRILVGTNLVRLAALECVTSKIYGESILPHILEHVVTTGDPLSQAYLMDCLVQVFPDEYHIETLPILLNVCPRLRDKVNIRTILQGLMDRLANYLAEEELLDESDTNQVKKALARDSFSLFEECVQKVYNSRGPKLTSKEVIRLQTALLQFSIKCYPGNMEQVSCCINSCVSALRQANASYEMPPEGSNVNNTNQEVNTIRALDDASVVELEKLLSIPLDSLALRVLELDQYSVLIGFLPWENRRAVAMTLLKAVESVGTAPKSLVDIQQLFSVIEPLVSDRNVAPNTHSGGGMLDPTPAKAIQEENRCVSKLVHLLHHDNTDTAFEMLKLARNEIAKAGSGPAKATQTLVAVVFAALKLARCVYDAEQGVSTTQAETTAAETETSEPEAETKEADKADVDAGNNEESEEKVVPSEATDAADAATKEADSPPDNNDADNIDAADIPTKSDVAEQAKEEEATDSNDARQTHVPPRTVSSRKIFVFIQETIATIAIHNPEKGIKLHLDAALSSDTFAALAKPDTSGIDYSPVSYEFLSQAFALYEEHITDCKTQVRCINALSGALLALQSISQEEYGNLITKTAQFSARVTSKSDQCRLVSLCAHLFYPVGGDGKVEYSNPQRALECLQRSLKLADSCTSTNPAHVTLFVDLLEQYLFFFEKGNPLITHGYISGLVALIKEHLSNPMIGSGSEVQGQYVQVVHHIKERKANASSSEKFEPVQIND